MCTAVHFCFFISLIKLVTTLATLIYFPYDQYAAGQGKLGNINPKRKYKSKEKLKAKDLRIGDRTCPVV